MQTLELEKMGLTPMNDAEAQETFGGDTGYYGKGPDLDRLGDIADFVNGFLHGLLNF